MIQFKILIIVLLILIRLTKSYNFLILENNILKIIDNHNILKISSFVLILIQLYKTFNLKIN